MDRNRELGVITSDPKVVSELNAVVTGDYSNCRVSTGCRNYS
jgi:hypothetical protein